MKERRIHFLADTAELKAKAAKLYRNLGLDMTSAFNMFMRESVKCKGIPFNLSKKKDKEK